MADVSWAQQQVASGNAVRRASIPSVYIKMGVPNYVPWQMPLVYFASDDSIAVQGTYSFNGLDDCAANDWELHT